MPNVIVESRVAGQMRQKGGLKHRVLLLWQNLGGRACGHPSETEVRLLSRLQLCVREA